MRLVVLVMKKARLLLVFITTLFILCSFTIAQAQAANKDKVFGLDGISYSIPSRTLSIPDAANGGESEHLFLLMQRRSR